MKTPLAGAGLRAALAVALSMAAPASSLRAWNANTHSLVADVAIRGAADLQKKVGDSVPAEKLESLLADWSQLDAKVATVWPAPDLGKTAATFTKALEINPAAKFGYLLGENFDKTPGSPVAVSRIFETYVNEPDWGMDQYVCANYPCDASYNYMGANDADAITTQAFRHMRWPGGYTDVENYIEQKLKLTDKGLPAIGQAPDRCQLYFDLSVKAVNTGHPYWALRFLAWSMHYAQDVTQPFHAAQIPSPNMVRYKNYTDHLYPDKTETSRVIKYYHMAFENYMDTFAQSLQTEIAGGATMTGTPAQVTLQAADLGAKDSVAAGDLSLAFFPEIPDAKTLPSANIKPYLTDVDGKHAYSDALQAKEQKGSGDANTTFKELAGRCMGNAGGASKTLLTMFASRIVAPPPAPAKTAAIHTNVVLPSADAVPFQ